MVSTIGSNCASVDKSYIESVFRQYINSGPHQFREKVLVGARKKILICHGVDLELLHLSLSVLERARAIERETGGKMCIEWRNLAVLLRSVAHKIHRECTVKSDHEGFLKLVK